MLNCYKFIPPKNINEALIVFAVITNDKHEQLNLVRNGYELTTNNLADLKVPGWVKRVPPGKLVEDEEEYLRKLGGIIIVKEFAAPKGKTK